MSIRDRAYVVGVFEHPTRKADGISLAQLHAEVARGALADAGLTKDDVDGYFCAGDAPGLGGLSMADYMGLRLRHIDTTETGRLVLRGARGPRRRGHRGRPLRRGADHAGRPPARGGHGHRHRAPQLRRGRARRGVRGPVRPHGGEPVRDGRDAPHARVRDHQRAARVDQGRGLASRPAQSARDAARGRHRRGRGGLADDLGPAAPSRLLRDQRRRRCGGRGTPGGGAGPQAPAASRCAGRARR